MKSKIPASLDGLLERIQLTFNDLERQEKRALHMFKKREEEILRAKEIEGSDENRTLKEIEILDSLSNKTLDIINVNNKNKIDLVKFYGNAILNRNDEVKDKTEDSTSDNEPLLTDKELESIRKNLKLKL
jgi:hypothetical protein